MTVYKTMDNQMGKLTISTGPLAIAMLNYQRVFQLSLRKKTGSYLIIGWSLASSPKRADRPSRQEIFYIRGVFKSCPERLQITGVVGFLIFLCPMQLGRFFCMCKFDFKIYVPLDFDMVGMSVHFKMCHCSEYVRTNVCAVYDPVIS